MLDVCFQEAHGVHVTNHSQPLPGVLYPKLSTYRNLSNTKEQCSKGLHVEICNGDQSGFLAQIQTLSAPV